MSRIRFGPAGLAAAVVLAAGLAGFTPAVARGADASDGPVQRAASPSAQPDEKPRDKAKSRDDKKKKKRSGANAKCPKSKKKSRSTSAKCPKAGPPPGDPAEGSAPPASPAPDQGAPGEPTPNGGQAPPAPGDQPADDGVAGPDDPTPDDPTPDDGTQTPDDPTPDDGTQTPDDPTPDDGTQTPDDAGLGGGTPAQGDPADQSTGAGRGPGDHGADDGTPDPDDAGAGNGAETDDQSGVPGPDDGPVGAGGQGPDPADDDTGWPDDGPSADDADGPDGPWPDEVENGNSQSPTGSGPTTRDPSSAEEISRRLAAGADGATAGRDRPDRAAGAGGDAADSAGWADPFAGADEGAPPDGDGAGDSDVSSPDTTVLDSLTLLGPDGADEAVGAQTLPGEIDVAAPATETAANRRNRPALWATAVSFAALLIISAGWVWTSRRLYDPA